MLAHLLPLFLLPPLPQHSRAAGAPGRPRLIVVSGYDDDALQLFHAADGHKVGSIPVAGPEGFTRGSDGLLYVASVPSDAIVRVELRTRQVLGTFVGDDPATPGDESGGLDEPTGCCFGPDGNLYVPSFSGDDVLRYDGATGAFLGIFVAPHSGGLNGPGNGTTFGPDGNLYVPSFWNDRVLRYDGATGAFIDTFVPSLSGGLQAPRDLQFHDGLLYVASSNSGRILRFDLDGNFVDRFVSTHAPHALAFNPDDGDLYVASPFPNEVRVFDGTTGAPRDVRVSSGVQGAIHLRIYRP